MVGTLALSLVLAQAAKPVKSPYPVKVDGGRHTLVLFSDGTVGGWGPPDQGALGESWNIPRAQNNATRFVNISLPGKAVDIACGSDSSFAVLADGSVVGWGSNESAWLGMGESAGTLTLPNRRFGTVKPTRIPGLEDVVAISGSYNMFLALTKWGTVYTWGTYTLFGDGTTPKPVIGLTGAQQVSVGTSCMALDSMGYVYTWGDNSCGTLARKTDLLSVERVKSISKISQIAGGNGMATVVKTDGSVLVWGANHTGQFGNGRRSNPPLEYGLNNQIAYDPRKVPGITNVAMVSNSATGFTLALLKDGTIRSWGRSDRGQLGAGNTKAEFQLKPVKPKITGVEKVWAIGNNGFALKKDKSFWMWGDQVPGGYPLAVKTPVPVKLKLK